MDFSVIIATRNRPVLVKRALQSVLAQTHPSVEIVLVKDGSDDEHAAAYAAIERELGERGRFLELRPTRNGHGQSYAFNRGVEAARGAYVCFLDDDDLWTDPEHLSRAWAALSLAGRGAETFFTCQNAYFGDVLIDRPLWLANLEPRLRGRRRPAADGVFSVTVDDLMQCEGFAHVNTTIVGRDLITRIGGFEESIRYENDRDFYHRIIDDSRGILFSPRVVSQHTVPDPNAGANMSTSASRLERAVISTYVWNRARILCKSPAIRRVATKGVGYTLREIALDLGEKGLAADALQFGLEALGARFSFKWAAYCGYLAIRAALSRTPGEPRP